MFCVKLYIGLASNSISIYSDGINNLFDSLSGLLSVMFFILAFKKAGALIKLSPGKTEQLLSLMLSVFVGAAGVVFLYSSLERLMYPTPIWFQVGYPGILAATAFVKLMMFFYFRHQWQKTGSAVVKLLAVDSILDTLVTVITILGFVISGYGGFAADALCGIIISGFIIFSAVKAIILSCRQLTDFVDKDKKAVIEKLLENHGITKENSRITFSFQEQCKAYLETDAVSDSEELQQLRKEMLSEAGIQLYVVK